LHVSGSVTSTPSTDIAAWTAAVRDGAEMLAGAMDRQTQMFGTLIHEVREVRMAVDRLSASTASTASSLYVI
jgi:hypothetical protein